MKIIRFAALILCGVLLVITPVFVIPRINNQYKVDIIKESSYKGVLVLWHVETFEGGSTSRASYLEQCARSLEKTERNLFVLVKTMDAETLMSQLAEGNRPDMISFGAGLGGAIENFLFDIGDDFGIAGKYAAAGIKNGLQLALPYMAGGYALIGDTEMLKSAGVPDDARLSDYTGIELKEKSRIVPALTVGKNAFIRPEKALTYNTGNIKDQYAAYEAFMSRKSVMLLGTQRDINRLINREELGRGRNVRIQYLSRYTDLMQCIGLMNGDSYKRAAAALFIGKLLSDYGQGALSGTGMFSVSGAKLYPSGMLSEMEEAVRNTETTAPLF